MKISSVVLVHTEPLDTIRRCIDSLQWCGEIIIITDVAANVPKLKKICRKVYYRRLNGDFANQRNYGLAKAHWTWVLFVDADEIIPKNLAAEIKRNLSESTSVMGYFVKRQDTFMGKVLRFGETAHVCLLRLGNKRVGRWRRPVHEIWAITGPTKSLRYPLQHFPHPGLKSFLKKIDLYTTLEAKWRSLDRPSQVRTFFQLICFPPAKFIRNYLLKLGFLDGLPGLVMALAMSFHSFLLRFKLLVNPKKI